MSDRAAIAAQVVDIQNDRQHKGFIKVTLHVPAEHGAQLTTAMGWPTYTEPVPVALARLDVSVVGAAASAAGLSTAIGQRETQGNPGGGHVTEPSLEPSEIGSALDEPTPRRSHNPIAADKRMAQRAGILCNDPMFQRYLDHRYMKDHGLPLKCDKDIAAEYVREFCKVESRADIRPNTEAATRLDLLESAFICWRDLPELVP